MKYLGQPNQIFNTTQTPKKYQMQSKEISVAIQRYGNIYDNPQGRKVVLKICLFMRKAIFGHLNPILQNLISELHKFDALKGKGINDPEREIIQILLFG